MSRLAGPPPLQMGWAFAGPRQWRISGRAVRLLPTLAAAGWLGVAMLVPAGPLAVAQDEPATSGAVATTPVLPLPRRLPADWWQYFDTSGAELETRIKAFTGQLAAVERPLAVADTAQAKDLVQLIDEIRRSLRDYGRVHDLQPPALPEPPALPAEPNLQAAVQLGERVSDASLELDLERDDLARKEDAIRAARQQLDTRKAAYLALPQDDPDRLAAGLGLIRDRLRLALAAQEVRLRKPDVTAREARLQQLNQRLDSIPERLTATPAATAHYDKLLREAQQDSATLNAEAATARLSVTSFAETALDRARADLRSQELLDYEVRIADADLRVAEAQLSLAIVKSLLGTDAPAKNGAALSEPLRTLRTLSARIESSRAAWRTATSRERRAAQVQLSLVENGDSALAKIHNERIQHTDDTIQHLQSLNDALVHSAVQVRIAEVRLRAERGQLSEWIGEFRDTAGNTWQYVQSWITASLFTIGDTPVTSLGILRIVLILVLAWWISKLVLRGIQRASDRREAMNRASLYTLGRLVHYLILTVGFIIGLSSIGIDFTKFTLVASAFGIGLGFGLQTIFSNFVAGLIILFDRSLKVGDFVDLESGVTGEVREINIRSTLVTTNDNIDVLVPNSEFVNSRVTNWTHRDAYRRTRVAFGVAYGTDKELVRKAVLEAANRVKFTLKGVMAREPSVWLVEFGDSSLNFELVVWLTPDAVKRPATVNAAYCWEIETSLTRYGIEIPFPQRDLHIRSVAGKDAVDVPGSAFTDAAEDSS